MANTIKHSYVRPKARAKRNTSNALESVYEIRLICDGSEHAVYQQYIKQNYKGEYNVNSFTEKDEIYYGKMDITGILKEREYQTNRLNLLKHMLRSQGHFAECYTDRRIFMLPENKTYNDYKGV